MEFAEYKKLVSSIPYGKSLPDSVYIHESAIDILPQQLGSHFARAIIDLELDDKDWNILKFFKREHKVTLLNYPDFFADSYPSLHTSYTVDLGKKSFRKANYVKSNNPPILHRKETFLKPDHPLVPTFIEITQEGETIGLYEKSNRIGFKLNWERLIKSKGYFLDDGRLKPLTERPISQSKPPSFNGNVERHKTAIDRNQLSQPMQALARHNYLNDEYSVLDYGSGKGDDVRELEAHGIDVTGWDPVHSPDEKYSNRDIVNLGFVLNVIEDRQERKETLINAWDHTDIVVVV